MASTTIATKWDINLRIVVSQRIFRTKMLMLIFTEVDEVDGAANIDLCAVISECNIVENSEKWVGRHWCYS